MIAAVVVVAVVLVLGAVALAFGRRTDVLSDVERFHRARGITTSWSREGAPTPVLAIADESGAEAASPRPE